MRNSCLQPPRGEMRFGDSPLWFATCCRDGKGAPIPGFSQEMGAGRGHRGEPTSPRAPPELPQSSGVSLQTPLMESPCTALLGAPRWVWECGGLCFYPTGICRNRGCDATTWIWLGSGQEGAHSWSPDGNQGHSPVPIPTIPWPQLRKAALWKSDLP